MLFGEGPQIKNIAADLNKLFRQGSLLNQSGQTVEGDSTADQGTSDLLAARDPVIQEISVGMSGEQSARYTVSGTPPLSLPNSLGKPLKAWSVDLLPYQEGTGDPSPSNVRPIYGTDKLTITTIGANLLPAYTQSVTQNGVTYTANPDGSVTVNGTATATNIYEAPASIWQWDGVSDVWLSGCPTGGDYNNGYSLRIDASGYTGRYSKPDIGSGIKLTPVTPSEPSQIKGYPLSYCIVIRNGTVCDNLVFRPMLNYGLSALPYTPYLAPSQTVLTLPQTVYAGTIGSEGGESRWGEVDLGTLEWTLSISGYFVASPTNKLRGLNMLCSARPCWNRTGTGTLPVGYIGASGVDARIYYIDPDITSVAELIQQLTGVQLVYELDNPVQFPLTAPTIPTPTGTATTWATAEDGTVDGMEVTYVGKA